MAPLITCNIDEGIACIRMQDEAGKNALSRELIPELEHALHAVSEDAGVKVIVLAGLPEYFCTGASRAVLEELLAGGVAPRDLLLPRAVLDVNVPLIAAMEGHALGGGLALGLCADIIVAAKESRYGCNFMNYGFTPGVGATRLLEYVLGPTLAHEMLLTGRTVRGSHFEGRGGFNSVLPRQQVMAEAMDLAARIAEKPRLSLMALKISLSAQKRQIFEAARSTEILMHHLTLNQTDVARLVREEYTG